MREPKVSFLLCTGSSFQGSHFRRGSAREKDHNLRSRGCFSRQVSPIYFTASTDRCWNEKLMVVNAASGFMWHSHAAVGRRESLLPTWPWNCALASGSVRFSGEPAGLGHGGRPKGRHLSSPSFLASPLRYQLIQARAEKNTEQTKHLQVQQLHWSRRELGSAILTVKMWILCLC